MPRELYDLLLRRVGPRITKRNTSFRQALGPAQRLAICLRYLATGDSFFSYRVGLSTVCMVVKEVSAAIWEELQPEFMPAPSMDDWLASQKDSAIAGTSPTVSVRWMGSMCGRCPIPLQGCRRWGVWPDKRRRDPLELCVWGRSTRRHPGSSTRGSEPRGRMPFVFVGDEAFPLRRDLMRPYPGPHGPGEKRAFNYLLSRARLVVECAFGILSSQWRMYKRVMAVSPTTAETCVRATCVLHNFLPVLTLRRRQYQNQPYTSSRRPGDPDDCLRGVSPLGSNNATREALGVRAQFTSYFSEEGAVPSLSFSSSTKQRLF
ncbi:hypothetical protein ACEWY4_010237 [Coilia grayii]|uniref:DDE Tnp4 domain-containing protein n=1 Tax=Coilia grayii TaxID=363190 RepID=A0ABD1K1E6_9TELE